MKQLNMRAEFKQMTDDLLKMMYEYQKMNNVKGNCVSNCQYVYDQIEGVHFVNVKFKAVIATGIRKQIITDTHIQLDHCSIVHLVLDVNDGFMERIIDPSYEVIILEELEYYDSIKKWKENHPKREFVNKKSIKEFLNFVKIAEQMNNGQFYITNKEWYNGQADYISDETHKYPLLYSVFKKNTQSSSLT